MSKLPFDMEAVRRKWARSIAPPPTPGPARLVTVETPRNVPADVRVLVQRIQELATKEFPERTSTLEPFFVEAARLVEQLDHPDPKSKDDPAKQLSTLLNDMEELFDAFTLIRR